MVHLLPANQGPFHWKGHTIIGLPRGPATIMCITNGWNAYALNSSCNAILTKLSGVKFSSGDATTKASTVAAWAYFWKGWAYAAVGSQYYSGLLVDGKAGSGAVSVSNDNYVLHDVVVNQSSKYFLKADSVLATISSTSDYGTIMGELIPPYLFQTGHGLPSFL